MLENEVHEGNEDEERFRYTMQEDPQTAAQHREKEGTGKNKVFNKDKTEGGERERLVTTIEDPTVQQKKRQNIAIVTSCEKLHCNNGLVQYTSMERSGSQKQGI